MSDSMAPQRPGMVAGETRSDSMSFAGRLDPGELLTGTPAVVATPAGLAFANPLVSTEDLTLNGRKVAAGRAVTFAVSGGAAGVEYTVSVTVATTQGQTLIGRCVIPVEA